MAKLVVLLNVPCHARTDEAMTIGTNSFIVRGYKPVPQKL